MLIDEPGTDQDMRLSTLWSDASPRSDAELADTGVKKRAIGVPRSQLLRELGYPEEDIPRFLDESDAEALAKSQMKMNEQESENGTGDTTRSTAQPTGQNTRGVRQ